MHLKKICGFLALWSYPLGTATVGMVDYVYHAMMNQAFSFGMGHLIKIAVGGLALPAVLTVSNMFDYLVKGKTDFEPSLSAKNKATEASESKKRAMYPKIPAELLSAKPEGLIVGRAGKDYVRIPIDRRNIMNSVIIGSPGSGKSAGPFLTTLIANFMQEKPPLTVFALDIKPELAKKSLKKGELVNVKIVDFSDRDSCGWDVYSALSGQSSDDEKMRVFNGIVTSLIVSSNPKDSFFVNNARNVTKGLLLYHYNRGEGFINSITAITANDIMAQIKEVLADGTHCPKNGMVYALLKKYADKDSEAFQDIELTINEHLNIFLNNEVQYHLRDNRQKASPQDLNNGTSVFVCLPLFLLDEFNDLLRLITYQVCSAMESRGEDWQSPVLMLLDELARLGKIDCLKSLLSLGRSAGISVNMAFQDMSQLESVYSKADARTIFNLSEITMILSCKDTETTKMLADIVGEYREEKVSRNRTALLHEGDGKQHVSEEYRKILDTSDFQDLRKKQESVLIVEGKYYRIKQLRYYQDKALNKRYEDIVKGQGKGD